MKTVAVVLAGGTGSRMRHDTPKQLLKLTGRTIIEHTLDTFERSPAVDEVVIVMATTHVDDANEIVRRNRFRKVTAVVPGGATRSSSSVAAIDAIGDVECKVLFHDAVRPFVSERIITECVEALDRYNAVDVAIDSADTIIEVGDGCISEIPERSRLRRGQTPQGFRLSTIRRAYELAALDPDFAATDDCGVVLRYLPDEPIYVVRGSDDNIKITHALDLFIGDKLFQLRAQPLEHPADAERRAQLGGKTLVVFGGSYGIGKEVADIVREAGANVFPFSRTETGTDVRSTGAVEGALDHVFVETGRIDFVVVTAALLRRGSLTDMTAEDIAEQIEVNYAAPVTIARTSAPYLRKTSGHLLLFTSSSYTRGRAGYSLYSSTKAAVVNLTQALAEEWAEHGIRVNCINPERTKTPMRTRNFGDEPADTLLDARFVAERSVDVLLSEMTGQVVDLRVQEPGAAGDPDQDERWPD